MGTKFSVSSQVIFRFQTVHVIVIMEKTTEQKKEELKQLLLRIKDVDDVDELLSAVTNKVAWSVESLKEARREDLDLLPLLAAQKNELWKLLHPTGM